MMKNVGASLLTSLLKGIFIFYVTYFILGTVSLYAIIGSIGIIEYLETGDSALLFELESLGIIEFLSLLGKGIYNSLPFANLIKPLTGDNSAILPAIAVFCKNIATTDLPALWEGYLPHLWRDIAVSVVAHCLLFACTRLKSALECYSSLFLAAALTITTVLCALASFCVASCIITILEYSVGDIWRDTMYFCVTAIVCGIHSVSLFAKNKESKFRVAMLLGTGAVFNAIRILFIWFWMETVKNFFDAPSLDIKKNPLVTALFVGVIFCVLECLEAHTLKALKEAKHDADLGNISAVIAQKRR